MAAKILACISTSNITVAQWRRGRLMDLRRFSDADKGRSEFKAYLSSLSKSTISIIVDSIDEDYRTETLPHTAGADRAQLISRKLRQLFRSTPYAAAGLQEQTRGNRRDDQYLFAALTRPELLGSWLRVITELSIPITGIYLLPVVALSVVDRLEIKRPNLLIVSNNESGLRQTFCKDGKLSVSRLTPPREDNTQSTTFYAEEINSTRMYLDALTLTHVDDIVTVLILDHDGSLTDLRDAITEHRPNMECLQLGPAELQSAVGISEADASSCPDALHLYLLATTRPTMNLAPSSLKTRLQVHLFGKVIYAAAGGVAGLAVLWSLVNAALIIQASGEIERLTQRARTFQLQYQAVTERFPKTPAGSELLRDSVEAAKQINARRQTPNAFMMVLGSAMNGSPNIGLNRIEWLHGAPELVESELQTTDLEPHLVNGIGQFGIVGAEVLSYKGDHHAALRNIRAFTRLLAGDERIAHVAVIRLPLDLDPNAGLNGSTATEQTTQTAPFEIAVVLKSNRETQ
ncbi:MAG: hypothetical protein JSU95_11735 [Betaproteobacteria bacterium]|nr:MAG: hypothetical protein JSU95_11735 [Betaproteobacteria bacterium]